MTDINVVPYIDVMLVLLVIFMVTAPMAPPGVIDLPTVGRAAQMPVKPLEVLLNADGTVQIRDRERGDSRPQTVARTDLARIARERQTEHPNQPVVISADRKSQYESVLTVMDDLQKQGVARVGLLVKQGS
ncbi:biopolymer transport protein TolR [Pigmentiphaga litoralis]|jgi:biopolymer transport protein TolR|uniref:Biopolymer transport protein TolR n=2 Tax=Pigmentiphaga litoralis TaxID=516702 RepID=A0A7Y9LK71_9BURK|nr:biopolymer transport protein TolR [Pigmentiphaga litoralis]NYE82649.1 biopolymer transport protein TolR [Pigmentiphaga litoralis]GGX13676.1 protein TolR [Pigmentiphaga litoralis]